MVRSALRPGYRPPRDSFPDNRPRLSSRSPAARTIAAPRLDPPIPSRYPGFRHLSLGASDGRVARRARRGEGRDARHVDRPGGAGPGGSRGAGEDGAGRSRDRRRGPAGRRRPGVAVVVPPDRGQGPRARRARRPTRRAGSVIRRRPRTRRAQPRTGRSGPTGRDHRSACRPSDRSRVCLFPARRSR